MTAKRTSASRKSSTLAQSTPRKKESSGTPKEKTAAARPSSQGKTEAKIKTSPEKMKEFVALKEILLTKEQNMKTSVVGMDAVSKKATAFMGEKDIPARKVFETFAQQRVKDNAKEMEYRARNTVLIARISHISYTVKNSRKVVKDILEQDYVLNKMDQTPEGPRLSSTVSALQYNHAAAEALNKDDIIILYIDKKHLTKEQMNLILG